MESTPTHSTSRGLGFRRDLQGLRALAVLLVVAYHADVVFDGGFIGVDVFFVVAGYVITQALQSELGSTGRLDSRRFYLRGIRRLLPALGLMLAVTMLASALPAPIEGLRATLRTGIAASLLNAKYGHINRSIRASRGNCRAQDPPDFCTGQPSCRNRVY